MSFCFTVPSKTFFLGEYVALKGGPSILLSTEPRFKLTAIHKEQTDNKGIKSESPTGKLLAKHAELFRNYSIHFEDPYKGMGGFGASSAQFIMLYALIQQLQSLKVDDVELLKVYERMAWKGVGIPPSGADLIAQLHGGMCFFYKAKKKLTSFSWPFAELDFALIHTGNKLATHKHLENLADFNPSALEAIVQQGLVNIEQRDSQGIIHTINSYTRTLLSLGFVAQRTEELLKQIATCPEILAAKGCGALGADVILMLFTRKNQKNVIDWCKNKGLNVIAYGHEVAKGGLMINDQST